MTFFPEIVTAGIFSSQIAAKNILISNNRKTSMFEIELPVETGGISYIDTIASPITADMIMCAKPGQIRHTKFPYKCYYVHMIIKDEALCNTLMSVPNFLEITKRNYYEKLFSEMCLYHSTGIKNDEMKLHSLILDLIYSISKDSVTVLRQGSVKGGSYLAIEEIPKYIKDNLAGDLSLEKLSKEVSMSPIYFHNCFKAAVGKTLREYVEEQRIKKAINLLTTNLTLTQIAFECGFSSQSYFSYVFKRKMNKTPREYTQEIYSRYEI